jgi:hypothetical protein
MAVTQRTRKDKEVVSKNRRAATATDTFNPSLKTLERFVGDWDMEISNTSFLPHPSDTAEGHVSFEWVEDGAFLLMRMGEKLSRAPAAVWLIGRDEASPGYQVLYYDSRQVSRVYQMSFSDGLWKMRRESPGFSQRYEGQIGDDGNTIRARWEKSTDGSHWEHDFDLTYRRVR